MRIFRSITFKRNWRYLKFNGIKLANSFACIGLCSRSVCRWGVIIKKADWVCLFWTILIVYYVITMQGEKLAKQESVSVAIGVWAADEPPQLL